jgi:hypothetical protein
LKGRLNERRLVQHPEMAGQQPQCLVLPRHRPYQRQIQIADQRGEHGAAQAQRQHRAGGGKGEAPDIGVRQQHRVVRRDCDVTAELRGSAIDIR